MPPDVWCQLCTISHQVRNGTFQKKMVDIRAWWDQNTCYSAVGRELVYKKKQVPNNELDATLIKHIQHPYVKSIVDSIGFHNHTAAKDVLQNHYQWLSKFLDPEMQMEMCNIVEEIDRTIQVIS
uniref:Protein kinase domain-containing protein n=1 Tax=Panagrellus redivivus TaxID=6233 RepID=A0A7E4W9L9_PANRE